MADSLYDTDYFAWTQEQARLLRGGAETRANAPVDWENVAEEIESLGRSDARAISALLELIVEHLLKFEYSPSSDPRRGWRLSIRKARRQVEGLLKESPSLRGRVPAFLSEVALSACESAEDSLMEYGELAAAATGRQSGGRYRVEQVLGDWFPDDPG